MGNIPAPRCEPHFSPEELLVPHAIIDSFSHGIDWVGRHSPIQGCLDQTVPSSGARAASSSSRSRKCTAVSVTLGEDSAAVISSLDDGNLYACCWDSELQRHDYCGLGNDEVCSIGIDAQSSCNGRGQGILDSFCTGTITGLAVQWGANLQQPECFSCRSAWQAHSRAPNGGASYSGVSAIGVDGRTVVTGGADGAVSIWCDQDMHIQQAADEDSHCGKSRGIYLHRHIPAAHAGAVTAVVTAAPLVHAASAGQDGVVRVWSPTSDTTLPLHRRDDTANPRRAVGDLVLDVRHHRVATGAEDSIVRMWDITVGCATQRFCHCSWEDDLLSSPRAPIGKHHSRQRQRGVLSVALDSGGTPTQMVSGGADGAWHLWDMRQASPVFQVCEHEAGVASLAVRGHRVLSASLDGCAILWDIRTSPKALEEVSLNSFFGSRSQAWDQSTRCGSVSDPGAEFPSPGPDGIINIEGQLLDGKQLLPAMKQIVDSEHSRM